MPGTARVLMCQNCGAPAELPDAAGAHRCSFCGAAILVHARDTGRIRFPAADAGLSPEQAERARLESLEAQADHYDMGGPYSYYEAPDDLEYLAAMKETDAQFFPIALQAFKMAVDRCDASGGQLEAQKRVYWIARKIKNSCNQRNEPLRARAAVETALDALTDPGYRQLLTCVLADLARAEGNLDACEAILERCDPRPPLLDLDSEYRTSAGMLALVRERPAEALALVGPSVGEVPYEPSSVFVFNSIRVEALERLGRRDEAGGEMEQMLDEASDERLDPQFLDRMYRGSATWKLAPGVLGRVRLRMASRTREERGDGEAGLGPAGEEPPDPPEHWLLAIYVVPLVFGLGIAGAGFSDQARLAEEATWRTAQGRVVEAGVEAVKGDDSVSFSPAVVYEYEVGGRRYAGRTISYDPPEFDSTIDAQRAADAYKAKGDVTVHYDPDSPSDAVLEKHEGGWGVPVAAAGILVMLVAIVLMARHVVITIVRAGAKRRWRAKDNANP